MVIFEENKNCNYEPSFSYVNTRAKYQLLFYFSSHYQN